MSKPIKKTQNLNKQTSWEIKTTEKITFWNAQSCASFSYISCFTVMVIFKENLMEKVWLDLL